MYSLFPTLALFVSVALSSPNIRKRADPRTIPPEGAIVVDNAETRSPSSFPTVQAGVDALSNTTTEPQTLFILSGRYIEQVFIPTLISNLTVQGYTEDATSYHANTVDITFSLALLDLLDHPIHNDDLTATVRQWNPNTKFYNVNIHNTRGPLEKNGQNLALSAHTTNQGFYGVQLFAYQDTILLNAGAQIVARSLIVGAYDFIFGQKARAWLDGVDIRINGPGWIVASGRAEADNPSWYVVHRSTVAGVDDSIEAGSNFLGRPWRSFARVVFQETSLSDVIHPDGWSIWNETEPRIDHADFSEFMNTGAGSVEEEGPRANFSRQLEAPVAIERVLGDGYAAEWWVDSSYLS